MNMNITHFIVGSYRSIVLQGMNGNGREAAGESRKIEKESRSDDLKK